MSGRGVLALVAATSVFAAGCSTSAAGPASNTPTTTETSLGIGPAPKVVEPLDPAKAIAAPCSTLTTQQASDYDIMRPGVVVQDPDGPACEWHGEHGITVRVTWLTVHHLTLAHMYEHWSDYSTWSPFTAAGTWPDGVEYPGVFASIGNNDADIYLAVNDNTLCRIHMNNPRGLHPAPPDSGMKGYAFRVLHNLEQG